MNKETKKQTNQMKDIGFGMMPPTQPPSVSSMVWEATKSSWAQVVSIRKPVHCQRCDRDIKPLNAAFFWDATNNYASIGYLSFGNTLLGVKVMKFSGSPSKTMCVPCIVEQ